ncbi:long-chain fatty acid transport protein 2-like [Mercenaria mercenaria]|uniref:long-chain fatty acid transport protein 2-like n=1 Tax=Mercenaria mercenaria TaxID=6596 RepID=UPI00234E94E0|nr:long-chain fatty acid transport protein 2-like [Mercenaria mercenaria]XP_045156371.2 long-chain fatty acid transport protein 2-like [Mercenaria mercenaria]XP_045156372.2 long-chain fatty acid transport protein 2-like [Mercenaria mercenaria]
MTSKRNKILIGAAGTVGAGIISWRAFFPWIGYDIASMKRGIKFAKLAKRDSDNGRYLIDMFEEAVAKHPKKPFVIFEDRVYSYEFMNDQANRVANIAAKWGLKLGECVAIMIENEPSFIWTFLGLQKLGIAVAFINYNINGQPLVHTLRACEAKVLITGSADAIVHSVAEVRQDIRHIPVFVHGRDRGEGFECWDSLMLDTLPIPVCASVRQGMGVNSPCCYIFTSGTTGLPKPVNTNQGRCIFISKSMQLFGFMPSDIVYTCTPLYHSAAGALGLMNTLDQGATMVLKRRFSAHHFFEDVRKHNVTVIQYIGELCRYLLSVPESSLDGKHKVRVAVGNGLRADIWDTFKRRYNIPNICEFFGATEGMAGFVNVSNKTGSCGRYSPLLRMLDPYKKLLVKVDVDTGDVVRDKNGHCIPVKIGEPGLLLVTMPEMNVQVYKGSREINEKKLLRNVLKEGDCYFNLGDMLVLDADYFLYFKDRIGDTFRWKGENVSTVEVSSVLSKLDVIQDANVYGVEIPGTEGRAGMASIHLEDNIRFTPDVLKDIFRHAAEHLPRYARPMFLRFPREVSLTTTLKQQKTQLRKEGFHPQDIDDPLFYYDEQNKTYSPLTVETYDQFFTKSKL